MKLKSLLLLLLSLTLMLVLTGCVDSDTNKGPTGATISDETEFSPPEEEGNITGSWNATSDELISNRYFYGSGLLVTIEQDIEEETWCFLANWSEEDDSILSIDQREAYKYNTSNGSWDKQEVNSEQIVSARFNDTDEKDQTVVIEQILPNGVTTELTYKRGTADIQIPDEVDISTIINDFLMQ